MRPDVPGKVKEMNESADVWQRATLPSSATIGQVICNLNETSIKIVLIINNSGLLEGTISDGDIRRGLLKGMNLSSPISNIINRNPLVVSPEMQHEMVMQLMIINKIQQIPIVDDKHQVVGLYLWDHLTVSPTRLNVMIIMAGGMGTRLRPLTDSCPKPLLRIAGKPMLEHVIERAKREGFRHFLIAIHYLGDMIEQYFGNGDSLGVKIDYLREKVPLGTAGALSLLQSVPEAPFIVTNGDVITDIQYGDLLDFHLRYNAWATMAVRTHEWQNPFGVVQTRGVEIVGFEEKPISHSQINAGVYVLDPRALSVLVANSHCDMPTLFERLRTLPQRTVVYPMYEPWLDVGQPPDLTLAEDITRT